MTFQPLRITPAMQSRFERVRNLNQLQRMDPVEFEYFIGYLYQQDGYAVSPTAISGDEGVDLVVRKGVRTTVVQCKRYGGTVGQPLLRDLYGTMIHSGADSAALVTTGSFSQAARSWADGKPIDLIDGHDLVAWLRQGSGVTAGGFSGLLLRLVVVAALLLLCAGAGFLTVALAAGPLGTQLAGLLTGTAEPTLNVPTQPAAAGSPGTPVPPGATDTPDLNLAPTITRPGSSAESDIVVPRLQGSVHVDGEIGEWPAVPTYQSTHRVFQANGWDGSNDLSATWRLAWTESGLYVGVVVEDDVHVQTESGRVAYQGDSLEMQLDTDREGDFGPGVNTDDFQVLFSPGDFGGNPPSAWLFRGTSEGGFTDAPFDIAVAAQPAGQGYVLEAFIPWNNLNMTPSPGRLMGLSLNATDNDTPGTAAQEVMYATSPNRRHTDPTTWGSMTLQE